MNAQKISIAILEPGKAPRQARVSSTPEEIQKIIGGYVEETHVCEDWVVLSRSDGWFCDLKACCEICGAVFFGTVILCGKQKGTYWTIVNKVDRKKREKLEKKSLCLVGRKTVIVGMRSDGIVKAVNILKKAVV